MNKPGFWKLITIFFALQIGFECSTKCNQNLLASFNLRGFEYSQHEPMQLCPHVRNRCCSLMDEVRIVQLWNNYSSRYSMLVVTNFINQVQDMYSLIKYFQSLSVKKMLFHYISFRVIRTQERVCGQNTHVRGLRRWTKFLELQRMFPGFGPVKRIGGMRRFHTLVDMLSKMIEVEITQKRRRSLSLSSANKINPKTAKITRVERKLVSSFFENPLKNFINAQKDYRKASESFNKEISLTERIVSQFDIKQTPKIKKVTPENESKNSQNEKKKARKQFLMSYFIFLPNENSFFNRFRFYTQARVPYIPSNTEIPYIVCQNKRRSLLKPIMVFNEHKYDHCVRSLEKVRGLNSEILLKNLEAV